MFASCSTVSLKSLCSPFTLNAIAALANPAPIIFAISRPLAPTGACFCDPSGSVIVISLLIEIFSALYSNILNSKGIFKL